MNITGARRKQLWEVRLCRMVKEKERKLSAATVVVRARVSRSKHSLITLPTESISFKYVYSFKLRRFLSGTFKTVVSF